jgi:hypothetical protein
MLNGSMLYSTVDVVVDCSVLCSTAIFKPNERLLVTAHRGTKALLVPATTRKRAEENLIVESILDCN